MRKSLDIILPIYNPPTEWDSHLIEADRYWSEKLEGVDITYIIVDDGSQAPQSSKTQERWTELAGQVRYLRYDHNRGKGGAVKHGAEASQADVLIYTDHDIPYQPRFIVDFYQQISNGEADLVLCHRDDSYYTQAPWARRIISRVLKAMIKVIVRIPTTDTQGGLKALSPSARNELIHTETDSYLFDLELVKRAHRKNLKIINLPVRIREGLVFSSMGLKHLLRELTAFLRIVFN